MADNVTMPGTEGIVASSKQQKVALEPKTFYNDPIAEQVAAVDPSTIKEAKDQELRKNIAFNEYLTNPARMVGSANPGEDYRSFRQIESMWRKPEFASIMDEYGSEMAVGGQMLADYVDWDKVSWWDKQVIGIRSARYGMRIGAARTKVAELEHEGADQVQIDEAKAELAKLEKYAVENSRPYESDTANAWASFGVSAARIIPETVATSLALSAIIPSGGTAAPAAAVAGAKLTGTLANLFSRGKQGVAIAKGLKAGHAIARNQKYIQKGVDLARGLAIGGAQAGIIYDDTYRVTMGDLYQRIKNENPGISDERAYEMADTSAQIQAAMESAPAFIGLGARAAITTELDTIVKSVLTKTPTDQIRRAAFIKYFQEEFNNGLGKRIAKGWLGDTLVDTVTEVAQQASENATLKLAEQGGKGDVTAATFERIGGFLLDPFNEEYEDELNTLISVAPAAAFFGGIAPGIGYVANKASKSSVGSKISDAFRSNRFGAQLRSYTQEMIDKVGAETLKEQLRGMASRGDAPATVRFDVAAIKELVDTDPELRTAMDKLGVLRKLDESQGNGGVVEVPIEEYNEVVNGEKSGALYQKVKDMVSFRLDAMTMTELNEWIQSTEAQNKKEMQEAMANERSVYNRMLNEYFANPEFERMTEGQKKANATLMQLVANRATRSLLSPMTAEEWFEKNVIMTTGEPQAQTVQQQKALDNVQQGGTIPSTTQIQGVQNEQRRPSGAETARAIDAAIAAVAGQSKSAGQGRPSVLHGAIWNESGRGTKGSSKAKGVRVLKLNPKAKAELAKVGVDTKNLTVLDGTVGNNAETFHDAIAAAKAKLGAKAASVDVKVVNEYKEMKVLILSEDKQTGLAIKNDGDIVSVFNANTELAGGIYPVLRAAIENGGNKLDCFDTFLPIVYSRVKFRAVARNNWVEMYKPEGWDKEFFSTFNNGEPDVVFMVYDPEYGQEYQRGDGELINTGDTDADYNAGATAQDEALKQQKGPLFQKAYAGSAVDYDRPSLEKIGTGEGNQAHGWGLYYALDPIIADNYRQKFTSDYRNVVLYDGKEIDVLNDATPKDMALSDLVRDYSSITDTDMAVRKQKFIKSYEDMIAGEKTYVKENKESLSKEPARNSSGTVLDIFNKSIKRHEEMLQAFKEIDPALITVKKHGQVHEVDIPEMDVLLDEQKDFNEQSDFVKEKLRALFNDMSDEQIENLKNNELLNINSKEDLMDMSGADGEEIYNVIGNSFKTDKDKNASKLLEKYGIKGITYEGRDDGRCFVIFNDKDVKVLRKKFDELGRQLFQKDEAKIAGWFDVIDGKYVIGLTDNWNATTFSHEVMHLYSRVMQDNYNNGTLSSYWKAQVEKLFDSVGAKPDAKGKYKLNDNQNELLAERFTTYMVENEIKNPELNSIFAVLRAAMRVSYAETGRTMHQPDKKTKEAFAVIFGAYDVAVAEQQALGLLEIEKPEGVSQEAYDHYMSFLLESRAKATHDMIKTYYAVEKYKKSKAYAKEYDENYTANLKAVELETRFKIKALAKQLGTQDVTTLLSAYNSVNADSLVTEDDVMAALNDTAEATQVAEARTAEMMEAKIREEFKIADDTTLVSKDMKNAAMAKAFLMEALMYEGKDWADFEAEYRDLLGSVDNEIQKMPLSKLQNSRRWNQLESLYALRYEGFASTGKKEKMAMVRRSQAQVVLIQNKMFEMNNRVDRFLEKFPKKLRTAQPQGQNIMSAESWDLLQSLMEKYGFKITDRRRSTDPFNVKLDNWLKNIEESQYCPISNIRYFMPETAQGHEGSFGSMTVRQFEVLEHVATAINSVASREYTLFTESEKARYDALAKLTAERLKEKGIKPFDQNDSWWRKHFGILSNIVNPEPVMKALFPEEVQRMLIRPFFSAAAAAETKFNEWNDMWNNMIKNINLSNTKKQYATGDIISYNNVANLLLAMGNEHSYENWRLFLHLDEAKAEAIVAEALAEQPELAKFANAYWKMMAETTDIMNDSYRKRYNKLFVKKQPRAFKIGDYEFTGGYVPETKLVSELPDDAGWESIVMGELSNEKLLSDKPDGQDLQSIVDHTRSRLRLFARWGHVAPAFNNLVKFAQREDVGLAIGTRAQGYIKGWLRDYHTPAGDSAGLMHALMSATTTTVLGIRFPQALLQLSGFIPAMGILGRGGIRYMVSAIGHTFATGGFHQVAAARDKSEYMKARYSDPVKTLFGVSKAEVHINKAFDKYQKFAMSIISYMDAVVANATWTASYRMAIDDGLSEIEAREKADQNVRLSQTDALSVSRSRAMKSDWARIITPFSTYMMGMQSVVRGRIAEKEYYGAFTFAISYIAVSTFFEAMLKEIPYPWEEDDDKNYIEKVLLRWYNDTVSTAGSTLYPIANLGSYATETFAQSVEKLIDPDEKTWIDMYGYGSLAALSYAKQYPDAVKYGMIGVFNGDEDAQRKAIANFVGWFSAGGKRMVKDLMEE